mmetsp:Transcript_20034/g.44578  ORF Transcript_20034/g.44578 Transcript_20034/m.44578 type:complete len:125 (-) Transcript_20034:274-648(-)
MRLFLLVAGGDAVSGFRKRADAGKVDRDVKVECGLEEADIQRLEYVLLVGRRMSSTELRRGDLVHELHSQCHRPILCIRDSVSSVSAAEQLGRPGEVYAGCGVAGAKITDGALRSRLVAAPGAL